MRGRLRGQLSLEFIIVFTGLLMIVALTTIPMYDQARADAEKVSKLADAREAANTIVSALNTVYAGGVGSKQTVEYLLPEDILSISFDNGTENCVDVRIELNLESDNVVQVSTVLSSRTDENQLIIDNENFDVSSGTHRMTFTYEYRNDNRYIEIKVA